MKSLLFFLISTGLIWFNSSSAQTGALKIKPEKPKPGEKVTLIYAPEKSSSGITGADAMEAELLMVVGSMPENKKVPLKKGKKDWQGSYVIPEKDASAFLIKITSDKKVDDNNGDSWKFLVYGKDKKPVRNACLYMANFYMMDNLMGFKIKKSTEEAKKSLEAELASYPDNINALTMKWSNMMKEKKGDETKELIKKELLKAFEANKNDEKSLGTLLGWFSQVGLEKRGKEIKDSIIAANPKGTIAFQEKYRSVMMNPKTPAADVQKLIADFPDMEKGYRSSLVNFMVTALVKAKEFDKANEIIEKENFTDGSMYNSLAWPLIEKGENLGIAVPWAKKGVDLLKKDKIKYKDDSRRIAGIDNSLGMILDTYGYGLEQTGKTGEALKAYEESFGLLKAADEAVNQRYVSLLVKNGEFAKAVEVSEKCLELEKADDKLIESYKVAYKKINGSADEVEARIARMNAEAKAKMMETLKKEMLNKPAPDFNLKDFDGNFVKLSDLKGKVVVVDFWATWCGPCKMSFPSLQKVQDKYKNNPDILILALDTWEREKTEADKEKKVKDFIAENKYTFKVLFDTDFVTKYGVEGIPTKFVIDKQGMIQFKSVGFSGEKKMISELEAEFEILK